MNSTQHNVLNAQELAAIRFSQDIQSDPASYQAYVKNNVDQLMNETLQRKRDAFQKTLVDTGRYMDMDHNAQLYKTRSSDVDKLQKVIYDVNSKYEAGIDSDKKLTRRQFEINEWAYHNKLETLFLLQLLFVSVLVLVVFLFLSKNGYISSTIAGSLSILFFLGVAYVGYVRWNYTNSSRDQHMWSRRVYPKEEGVQPNANGHCDAQGNYVIDLKGLIPDVITQNAQSISDKMQSVFSNLDAQAMAYQTNGTIPNQCAPPATTPPAAP
jgi:NADH:ubiquinone oxidoreductase subunit 3 (subunit A)